MPSRMVTTRRISPMMSSLTCENQNGNAPRLGVHHRHPHCPIRIQCLGRLCVHKPSHQPFTNRWNLPHLSLVITMPPFKFTIVSNIVSAKPSIITTILGLVHHLQPRKSDCLSLVRSSQHPVTFPVRIPTMSASRDSSDIRGKGYPQRVSMESDFGPEKFFLKGTQNAYINRCGERRFGMVAIPSFQDGIQE
ncbi:hypothetical protein BDR22DRAFT_862797 [Usnea florida]